MTEEPSLKKDLEKKHGLFHLEKKYPKKKKTELTFLVDILERESLEFNQYETASIVV